jgi:hypothetical protein
MAQPGAGPQRSEVIQRQPHAEGLHQEIPAAGGAWSDMRSANRFPQSTLQSLRDNPVLVYVKPAFRWACT